MRRFVGVTGLALAGVLGALLGGAAVPSQAVTGGTVRIVQAMPGATVRVSIDGKAVRRDVRVGVVLGPFRLAPGRHTVRFVDSTGTSMASTVRVTPGSSDDVVLHRPADLSDRAVVHVYDTPRQPIDPGKARVLLAHTATVAPADVQVDGTVVFTNIANGEFAEADVPAGGHKVALLPTGEKENPILGPLTVQLAPGTLTVVYAVGRPSNGSMRVISRAERLPSTGATAPSTIDTGSAGLVAGTVVLPFDASGP